MENDLTAGVHGSWNQCDLKKAPHPQEPEASEANVKVGSVRPRADMRDVPFQSLRNMCHHMRSALKL